MVKLFELFFLENHFLGVRPSNKILGNLVSLYKISSYTEIA